jgi:hypothetical protein
LFNLEHPEKLVVVTEVEEDDGEGDDDLIGDEADSTEDELMQRFNKMTFVVVTRKLEQLPQWVKVTEVFQTTSDREFLKRAGITNLDDPRSEKYSKRLADLRNIKKYVYRMDILERAYSYDEVTEIFVRVNSLGAKLRSSDLALAQITAKWRNSLKTFQAFQKQCGDAGFYLDLGLVLKNLVVFATGQSRFQTVGRLKLDVLQKAWTESCYGMEFALNFLKSNPGIDSPAVLASPFLLVTLAYFGHKRNYHLTPEESERLRFWVLVANAKGRYSRGSSGTILDQYGSDRRLRFGNQNRRLRFEKNDFLPRGPDVPMLATSFGTFVETFVAPPPISAFQRFSVSAFPQFVACSTLGAPSSPSKSSNSPGKATL